jgi:arsenite methyltransferase
VSAGLKLYRSPVLDEATQGALRPGGLELTERALAFCALPPGATVLDVGCGLGTTVAHLRRERGLDAVGLDLDPTLLRRAARRDPGARLVRASGTSFPLRDGSVAAVLMECSFSLVAQTADTARLLGECRRVLAPRGWLVVTDLYARDEAGVAAAQVACPACAAGLRPLSDFAAALGAAGFGVRVFEDHSRELAALMGRLMLGGAERGSFWELAAAPGRGASEAERAVRAARPGYLLLVAVREPSSAGGHAHGR